MAAIPFMPLYVADYMSDAAHLTTVEHGAYMLLLMTYWQRGEALPADDKKLARICRLEPRSWLKIKPTISEFFEVIDGKYLHGRVERELTSVRDKSLKNRKGGLARAKQMLSQRSANAQPYITDTDTVVPLDKSNGGDAASADKVFWDGAKGYLGKGAGGLINKLCSQHGREIVSAAITTAMLTSPQPPDRTAFLMGILRNSKSAEAVIGI